MYLNDTYPASNRVYSRPFACHFDQPDKPTAEFEEALHKMGDDLIGDPFHYCTDTKNYPPTYFLPAHWDEEKILKFSDTSSYRAYTASLSKPARRALASLVDQIRAKTEEQRHSKTARYNVTDLLVDFETLWNEKPFLDPRLTHAEEVFTEAANTGVVAFGYNGPNDAERYKATLNWMARPENAQKISLMFLYSRLAQHIGEETPVSATSFAVAQKIAAEIDAGDAKGVVKRLQNSPEDYLDIDTPEVPATFFQKVARSLGASRVAVYVGPTTVKNTRALAKSAEQMVADYTGLRNGTWARKTMFDLEAVANRITSPVRADNTRVNGVAL